MSRFAKQMVTLFASGGSLLCSGSLFILGAQVPSMPGPPQDSSLATATRDSGLAAGQSDGNDSGMALSARQLVTMMRSNPELMVEVKSLVAEHAQQEGKTIQADSLTDEEVYAQVYSNRQLRENLTAFLRARGYVSEEDIAATDLRNT